MNRTRRLLEIKRLIKDNKISNQEELLVMLNDNGYNFTQATLSRDLKFLKVGKLADDEKGHIYVLPNGNYEDQINEGELTDAVNIGFLSLDYTGNMAVVKTLPGFASGIAYKIDGIKAYEIIGTIAGDDTILVIAREGISRQALHEILTTAIPLSVKR